MSPISRGFHRRRQEPAENAGRVPPGQYVTKDFPVLSAGPTPHTALAQWTFSIGRLLHEVFGAEMTDAASVCGSCGTARQVAELAVYLRAPGTVVRCRSCDSVLMVFVKIHDRTCVDLLGLAALG